MRLSLSHSWGIPLREHSVPEMSERLQIYLLLNVGYAWLPLRCLFWDLEGDVSRVWRSLRYLRHSIPGRRFTWSKLKFTRLMHPVIGFIILCAHVSLHMNWPVHGIIVKMWVLISDVWLWNVTNPPKMTDKTQIWTSLAGNTKQIEGTDCVSAFTVTHFHALAQYTLIL